jgi:hypothetical protein
MHTLPGFILQKEKVCLLSAIQIKDHIEKLRKEKALACKDLMEVGARGRLPPVVIPNAKLLKACDVLSTE